MTSIQEEQDSKLLGTTQPVTISWHEIQVFSKKSTKFYALRKSDVPSKQIIRKGIQSPHKSHSYYAFCIQFLVKQKRDNFWQ